MQLIDTLLSLFQNTDSNTGILPTMTSHFLQSIDTLTLTKYTFILILKLSPLGKDDSHILIIMCSLFPKGYPPFLALNHWPLAAICVSWGRGEVGARDPATIQV